MALSLPNLQKVWLRWVNDLGNGVCQFDQAGLAAAVTAVDSWATANAASFNQALPEPFKSTATPGQKAAMLAYVCMARYGNL